MNKLISAATAFAAGLVAMYLLDAQSGRRRRAVLRDKTVSSARMALHRGQQQAQHLANQARGFAATRRLDRVSHRPPQSDQQLHERIRATLGRHVSHPHAVHVEVEHGEVTLTGDVLRHEIVPLLDALSGMAGIARLDNRLQEHAEAGRIPSLQGGGRRGEPERDTSSQANTAAQAPQPTAWH
ncbi:BON domain-containing protein [Ramlibacter rhizophilus]|uniref:BON domain-containing protein n=1 Tax=Ramlibacter rhizophilus TaxID=1781167 RepID=A0A4Z0BYB3_9BURK|nr:BON domain-containing protein [Ramlibacter rhizophilus]TFZ04327.1 BON domain-containing protein [Ramlibacter rhizophilus]